MKEQLANLQHKIWSHWMKYLFSKGVFVRMKYMEDDAEKQMCFVLPSECYTRWIRQMDTPYSDLSEEEKESDRDQANKVLALVDSCGMLTRIQMIHLIDDVVKSERGVQQIKTFFWAFIGGNMSAIIIAYIIGVVIR